jgi:hypothetical protein
MPVSLMPLRVWEKMPGEFFFVSLKRKDGRFVDKCFARYGWGEKREEEDFPDISSAPDYAERMDREGNDVYWSPRGFSRPRRLREYAPAAPILYSDLDDADPRKVRWRPCIAWRTSRESYQGIWILDREQDGQDLNERLNKAIDAGVGGWDATQVLRWPGTHNYKKDRVKENGGVPFLVKGMWERPTDVDWLPQSAAKLEREVPKLKGKEKAKNGGGSVVAGGVEAAAVILERYRPKLPPWLRGKILRGEPEQGWRSSDLWAFGKELLRAGASDEEVFVVLKVSPFNKFKDRRDEDERLWEGIRKGKEALLEEAGWTAEQRERATVEPMDLEAVTMDQVAEERIDWLWRPRLARGIVTIVEADPGIGKSFVMEMVAASLADGAELPADKAEWRGKVEGTSILCDVENHRQKAVKPRLRANGCVRMDRIVHVEKAFTLADDGAWAALCALCEKVKPLMVCFDTINTYIGRADTGKGSETTQALQRFVELARRWDCSVVLIRHLTKGGGKAIYRGQGNMAFSGVARIVLSLGLDPEDEDMRVLSMTKPLAGMARSLSFRVEVDGDDARLTWGRFVELTADDVIGEAEKSGGGIAAERCKGFLREVLNGEKVWVEMLRRAADTRGLAWRSVQRAAKGLQVEITRGGRGSEHKSYWQLPSNGQSHT